MIKLWKRKKNQIKMKWGRREKKTTKEKDKTKETLRLSYKSSFVVAFTSKKCFLKIKNKKNSMTDFEKI